MKNSKLTKEYLEAILVPGKWYDFSEEEHGQIAAKYSHMSNCGDYFHFSEYVRTEKRKKYNGNWYPPSIIKEIDESQIKCINEVWQIIDLPPKDFNYEIY